MRLIDADILREKWEDDECSLHNYTNLHFLDAIDNAPTVDAEPVRHGNWIPCSEKLPENCDNVLVTIKYNDGYRTEMVDFCDKFGVWNADCDDFHVVAWQPLPPAYKPKEDRRNEID